MSRRAAVLAGAGLALLAGGVWTVAYHRAAPPGMSFDFTHFYRDARHVWDHAALNTDWDHPDPTARPQLPFYLPAVRLALAPLAAWGPTPAAALWASLHVLALLAALRVLVRWTSPAAVATACLLALPAMYEAARFNQLSFFVLAMTLPVADGVIGRGERRAAVLLAAATVLKLLPGVLVVWLALKRRPRALRWCLTTGVAAAIVPCLIVFGPARTIAYHQDWLRYNLRGTPVSGMLEDGASPHFFDHRNQSFTAVATRALWAGHPAAAPWRPLELSRDAALGVGRAALLAAAVAFLACVRRGAHELGAGRCHAEVAASLLAMIIFSPLVRTYYLVWALPALTLALGALRTRPRGAAQADGADGAGRLSPARAAIVLAAWLAGMSAWPSATARAYGVHLGMLLVMSAALVMRRGQARAASVNSVISGGQFQRSL